MITLLLAATAAVVSPANIPAGHWVNPKRTVHVRTGACGSNLCGWVAWASPEATADAREAGVPNVVGIELLQNYTRSSATTWQGRVFVPDWNRTFSSTITQLSPTSLKISGCLIGGFICKSQIWTAL